jgi:hypothetical protein
MELMSMRIIIDVCNAFVMKGNTTANFLTQTVMVYVVRFFFLTGGLAGMFISY